MKRIIAILCCMALFFSFAGCTDEKSDYTEHQELIKNEISFSDDMLRFDLKEAGLEDVFIRDMSSSSFLVGEDVYARAYLIADDRYRGGMSTSDHYLMLKIEDKIILKDLATGDYNARMNGNIEVEDFDGDGYKEILVQEAADAFGGFGQYVSRVYKYDNGSLKTIFSSLKDEGNGVYTGFSCTVLEDYNLIIHNEFTGYEETFNYRDVRKTWYGEEDGTYFGTELRVDSFYRFEPVDVDEDGVYEIVGYQYTSLNSHVDYVGSAKTVLKYNNEKAAFEVVNAEFLRCESKTTQENK